MRKIDALKEILETQVKDPQNWRNWKILLPEILSDSSTLNLLCNTVYIGFTFDSTGEEFLGIFNWKD